MSIRIVSFFPNNSFCCQSFLSDNFYILSNSFVFVKNFFNFFFRALIEVLCVVFATDDILSYLFLFVNNFFIFLCHCSVGSLLPVAATLINLPHLFLLVNKLFQLFFLYEKFRLFLFFSYYNDILCTINITLLFNILCRRKQNGKTQPFKTAYPDFHT